MTEKQECELYSMLMVINGLLFLILSQVAKSIEAITTFSILAILSLLVSVIILIKARS